MRFKIVEPPEVRTAVSAVRRLTPTDMIKQGLNERKSSLLSKLKI